MIPSLLFIGAITTPLLGFVSLLLFQSRKVRLGFLWSSAFLGLALSWLFLLGLRFFLPHFIPLASWQPREFFPVSPALLADGISWMVGFVLVSVGCAVILTEATVRQGNLAFGWASNSLLVGLGLFAIFAGNQLTLLLAWAAIDLVELAIWLSRPARPTLRERVILAFSSRAFAVMLSLWGLGNPWAYLLSILLRWGVFPFHLPYLESEDLRRGLGTIIRLVPPLTTMPLLVRLADLGYFSNEVWIEIFLCLIALFAFILWVNSTDVLEGRPFWVIGTASFAFYAAALQQPAAVLAWVMILVFCGSYLFLIQGRDRFSLAIIGYSALLLLGLPFTPFWDMVKIYRPQLSMVETIYFIAHWLATLGYFRFVFMKPTALVQGEPWSIALSRIAFLVLVGTSIIIGYGAWGKVLETGLSQPYIVSRNWVEYFIGFGLLVVNFGMALLYRIRFIPRLRMPASWVRLLSMEWIYPTLQWGFRQIGFLFYQIEGALEGRGGNLWAMVLLFILARLLLFFGGGG